MQPRCHYIKLGNLSQSLMMLILIMNASFVWSWNDFCATEVTFQPIILSLHFKKKIQPHLIILNINKKVLKTIFFF
jgi:hypothetical protein